MTHGCVTIPFNVKETPLQNSIWRFISALKHSHWWIGNTSSKTQVNLTLFR